MNREELDKLRKIHETKGLRLDTASGLSGSIYAADGSTTAPVTALLDECTRSFDKDAEISKLQSQLEEARAEIERLKGDLSVSDLQLRAKRTTYIDDKVEEARAMAIEDCIAAARDAIERWSQTEGWLDAKVEDALRALLNGSANKEGGKS